MSTDNEYLRLIYSQLGGQGVASQTQGTAAAGAAAAGNPVQVAGKDSNGNIQPIATNPAGRVHLASSNWEAAPVRMLVSGDSTLLDISPNHKAWVVPAGKEWLVKGGSVRFVTSAVVGNRRMGYTLCYGAGTISAAIIELSTAGLNQVASQTYYYSFAPQLPLLTAAIAASMPPGNVVTFPVSGQVVLQAGDAVHIYEMNNVDAVNDTMYQYRLSVIERTV